MKASKTTTSTSTVTMAIARKAKDKRSKTKKTKAKTAPRVVDEKALQAKLEKKFVIDSFYELRSIKNTFGILTIGINLFLTICLPGRNYPEYACSAFWFTSVIMSRHINKYRGTVHEDYGMKLCSMSVQAMFFVHEIVVVCDNSLASAEGRDSHVSMVFLTKYFLTFMVLRITTNIRCKDIPVVEFIALPIIAYNKPRFGIFQPHFEALAFFVALGLGYLIGSVIDEMRWRHYLFAYKKELEIKEQKRELERTNRKAMALEDLACGQESPFFEIIRR